MIPSQRHEGQRKENTQPCDKNLRLQNIRLPFWNRLRENSAIANAFPHIGRRTDSLNSIDVVFSSDGSQRLQRNFYTFTFLWQRWITHNDISNINVNLGGMCSLKSHWIRLFIINFIVVIIRNRRLRRDILILNSATQAEWQTSLK